jgi:ribonuclease P protein component
VVRNRVKRLFREVFRKSHAEIPDSFDFILNARHGCAGAGYGVLRDDFVAAATKACRGESEAGA